MAKIYFYKLLSAALKKTEPVFDQPIEVNARISPSGKNQFVNMTFTMDTGASSAMISRGKLRELGLENYQVIDTVESELADGSTSEKMDVGLFDVQLFSESKDDPMFLQVPIAITDGDASELLLGRDLLRYYKIGIGSGNRLKLFQPDNEMLKELAEWSPEIAKMNKVKFSLDEVLKDASIQEPIQPIAGKKPDGLKPPEVPSLANEWKIPKPIESPVSAMSKTSEPPRSNSRLRPIKS